MGAFSWYKTPVWANGTPSGPSVLVSVWVGPTAPANPSAYDLVVIDSNGDGLIGPAEWQAATGNAGTKARGDNTDQRLYDPDPSGSGHDGYLYSENPIPPGSTGLLDGMEKSFTPIAPEDLDPSVICFLKGTEIATVRGPVPVEDLAPGDLVVTRDHGPQPVIWVGSRDISGVHLRRRVRHRPIRLAAGCLGPGVPARDLTVSPQHRILIWSPIVRRMTGADEALIPARHLTALPGIERDDSCRAVTYFHVLMAQHTILTAEGAQAESLLPTRHALRSLGAAARSLILNLRPDLERGDQAPARIIVDGARARRMMVRHLKNGRCVADPSCRIPPEPVLYSGRREMKRPRKWIPGPFMT